MPSNGIRGYTALSYVLSGDETDYDRVIQDLVLAFHHNPTVFLTQTDFGQRNPYLDVYKRNILHSVAQIDSHPFPTLLWMNDGHLHIFCWMFDLTLYVFDVRMSRWLVYNEHSGRGYACLLFNGSHFDVLQGTGTATPIPDLLILREILQHSMLFRSI